MTQSFGYGWLFPDDTVSAESAVAYIVRRMLDRVSTVKVVKVMAVHLGTGGPPAAAGTVDVQPIVNQIDGATPPNVQPHGTVYGLPYFRVRFGAWEIAGDPAVGDIGIVVVCDSDISAVKATQAVAPPGSQRRFSLSDGIYLGGILNAAPTQYLWLKSDGTLNIVDGKGNQLQTSSGGFTLTGNVEVIGTLTATKLETGEDGLAVTGPITSTGEITAFAGTLNSVALSTHLTPTAPSGPVSPPTPGT